MGPQKQQLLKSNIYFSLSIEPKSNSPPKVVAHPKVEAL